ncbi:hypothetical protein HMPREF1033_02409 [Tannerella sp. 6_1_58FAA_CT1]|nr:hypothetical protein HMPREF1033_02409 [Tannerella sp. 6_1_58FAA_CT1]
MGNVNFFEDYLCLNDELWMIMAFQILKEF